MNLTVFERLSILLILPKEGDYTTIKIVRKLREELSFSEEEHKKLKFETVDGALQWDKSLNLLKDVEIGEKATDVISDTLRKLSHEKRLPEQCFDIYEKFVQ